MFDNVTLFISFFTFPFIFFFFFSSRRRHTRCGRDWSFRRVLFRSLKDGDTSKQIELLTNWEKETPNDPELFPCYFNYYFLKSKQEIISISSEQPSGETLQVSDSSGQVSGFLGSQTVYDLELVQKGLDKINIGIEKYPNRLDMRFGKIYVLGQIEDWESFTNEIKKTIRYSQENNNSWTWSNNKKKENGKEFFLSSIQDYQITLFET